jgi:cytochrome c oxidase accessory protein FixG
MISANEETALPEEEKDELEQSYWHVNPGDVKIHATRIKGRFRNYKWMTASFWLLFFFGPYLRWDGRQAILFDIPHRKFHIFSITVWPQDVWMLALVLIFLFLTLFAVTAIGGRMFCGYLCFQTVWTDIFTLTEDWIEGAPAKRRKLDEAPWTFNKIRLRATKHLVFIIISLLTGATFCAYFMDAFQLWKGYFTFTLPAIGWYTLLFFFMCTYIFGGFMREQVCFWLCPYARIQGVMYDSDTILPTYDKDRGEPRERLKKGDQAANAGDCIDCNLCVAVCPTGIDIRYGQQEGCITCGLCIDACDSIMDKVGRPRGLVRYVSLDELTGKILPPLFKRPRVIVYSTVLFLAFSGIGYGLLTLGGMSINVIHERQPLFVKLSDGSIQNKYTMKIVNTTDKELNLAIEATGVEGLTRVGSKEPVKVPVSKVKPVMILLKAPEKSLKEQNIPIIFKVYDLNDKTVKSEYKSMFMSPKRR